MRTSNLDKVLDQVTGADCHQAAEELERYLDAGLTATRELLAAFLNDLNDECLARWGPAVTAARQPAFLHHPTRTTRSAGWRHSCRGQPSAVSYASRRDLDGCGQPAVLGRHEGERNPPARPLALAGLGLSVTSCQDDEGVIEKDGDTGTARQRVVAVEAPRQRAKPPSAVEVRDADGDRQCGHSAHADYR